MGNEKDRCKFVMQRTFGGDDPIFAVRARDWQSNQECEVSASLG